MDYVRGDLQFLKSNQFFEEKKNNQDMIKMKQDTFFAKVLDF